MTAAGGLCPGTCNSAYRKAHALYDAELAAYNETLAGLAEGEKIPEPPAAPEIRPWYRSSVWCRRCQSIIRSELAEIDDLAAMLAALPPGIRPVIENPRDQEKVTRSPEPPSPSPAVDTLDELVRWLLGVENGWRRLHRWPSPPRRGDLAHVRTTVIAWVGERLDGIDGILASAIGEEFGEQVRRWHRALRRASHAASYARHVKKPCPGCNRFTLWERVGEHYITCVYEDCNRRITREELDELSAA